MSPNLRIAYLSHSLRSDWNNGNAHFLRGLLASLAELGHTVLAFEPETEWSLTNLLTEPTGEASLTQFAALYPNLPVHLYPAARAQDPAFWREALRDVDALILHEWNPPALAHVLLALRPELGFKLLFHDTHHRASSSPAAIAALGTDRFDGVLVFGEALRTLYRERFGIHQVWTLHEAADTRLFRPLPGTPCEQEVAWIGNWGDDERSAEIREFLLQPAAALSQTQLHRRFTIYGVRYPEDGLRALAQAGVRYAGYLPNLEAPRVYAASALTVHIPRQQYNTALTGIPTIRVFEALACGIPLVSAPWQDTEGLFRPGDFTFVSTGDEMREALAALLADPAAAAAQAARGRETVLARHTCRHRAEQLSHILEEVLA